MVDRGVKYGIELVGASSNDVERNRQIGTITAGLAGALAVGGGIGALCWKKHRGLGFLLGTFILGPLAGGASMGLYMRFTKPKQQLTLQQRVDQASHNGVKGTVI